MEGQPTTVIQEVDGKKFGEIVSELIATHLFHALSPDFMELSHNNKRGKIFNMPYLPFGTFMCHQHPHRLLVPQEKALTLYRDIVSQRLNKMTQEGFGFRSNVVDLGNHVHMINLEQ